MTKALLHPGCGGHRRRRARHGEALAVGGVDDWDGIAGTCRVRLVKFEVRMLGVIGRGQESRRARIQSVRVSDLLRLLSG